ncbi:hypothetical protein GpartN1_g5880.t1 [Galdieria partita]|uniref:4-hydroxy-tetrahydrodipicolinate reductase n=1 Tax=Galdieria partita TaxID=83374 RepID=A0A9C7Q1F7_9RHOD|nr:hypothetical protein GpartN1_g5880.t1 [Galdieria partita]
MNFVYSDGLYDKNTTGKYPCYYKARSDKRRYSILNNRTYKPVLLVCCLPQVMVNGLPGKMSSEVLNVLFERKLPVVPYSLTAENQIELFYHPKLSKQQPISLLRPSQRANRIERILEDYPRLIAVDYTHPDAVNSNALFYQKYQIPFVMGTTGGDREQLVQSTLQSNIYAVIAPNMGKQIVALQTILNRMAQNFPGVFQNYRLQVTESHQQTKADTSGTAKEIIQSFVKMGAHFEYSEDLRMIRSPVEQQQELKIPPEYLSGHAFHTYRLTSPDKSVEIAFQHNVLGRNIYAQGTVDAVVFLWNKIQQKASKKLYNMMDVLTEQLPNN